MKPSQMRNALATRWHSERGASEPEASPRAWMDARTLSVVIETATPPNLVVFVAPDGREVARVANIETPRPQEQVDAEQLLRRLEPLMTRAMTAEGAQAREVAAEVVAWAEAMGCRDGRGGISLLASASVAERVGMAKLARILRALTEAAHGGE